MKKGILIALVFLVGVGMLLYPVVSGYLVQKNGSYVIDTYQQVVESGDQENWDEELDEAIRYNQNLAGSPAYDPFLDGSGMVLPEGYEDILNVGGIMGYVEIPCIQVNQPIYHGTSDEVLQKGVGHLEGSSLPVGGENTHAVITGHTGLSSAKFFDDLTELKEGDMFFFHVLGETLAYQVDQITVITPDEMNHFTREPGKDYATLLTCTPYGINSHRLLVRGVRVPYTPEVEEEIEPINTVTTVDKTLLVAAGITAMVMGALVVLVAVVSDRIRKRRLRMATLRRELMKWQKKS